MAKEKTEEKTERVSLNTAKFVDCWIQYEQSRSGRKLLLAEFIPLLAKSLGIPEAKIKGPSVQAKCYALNNRAVKRGLKKMPVPGSGKSPGSGLPDVDWDEIYSKWGAK